MEIMSLKNRLFKHKRKIITFIAVSLFIVSMYTPIFLSSQPSTNTNYLQTLLLNNFPINNNINAKDSWLSGWNCRKVHTITGSTAGAQTNYQMRITVHYGSGTDSGEDVYCNAHCRYDFGDVRFTKSDGITPLDYWLESKTNGDKATFWVEVDSIPVSPGTVNIYIYYGKIDASTTSNGDNTFIFFDDFLGTSVNGTKWNEHTDPSGAILVSSGELDMNITSGTGYVAIHTDNSITQSKCIVETKAKGVYDGGSIDVQTPLLCMVNAPLDQSFSYADENFFLGTDHIRHSWYTGPWYTEDYYVTTQPTTYKIFQIIKNGNVFTAKYLDSDYSEIASSNSRIVSDYSFYINMRTARPSECKYDWVRVCNYASPELTHGAWGSEEYPRSWLSGWAYSKQHTIVGSTAGAQTNYQMRIVVHYGSGTDSSENIYCNTHCRYDFGDIRFTNSDGTTLLDYWMESKTNGDKATFWVEVDSIPASPGTVNIYIYYGKNSATTTSNGDNTFNYFTDFPGSSLPAGWSQKHNEVGGYSVEGSLLKVWTDTNNHGTWQFQVIGQNVGYGYNVCLMADLSYLSQSDRKVVAVGLTSDNKTDINCYDGTHNIAVQGGYNHEHDEFITCENNTGNVTELATYLSNGDIVELARASSKCLFYRNHNLESTRTTNLPTGNLYIDIWASSGANSGGPGEIHVDWVAMRNYVDPEPTHGSWGSEESQALLIFTREFGGGNQKWDAFNELGAELYLNLNDSVLLNMSRTVGGVGGGAPLGSAFLESFVSISVNDSSALQGINITIHYTDSKVAELGLNENSLAIWYWNQTSGNWIQLPSTVDTINNKVTTYTDHLTSFAILGTPVFYLYLPFMPFFLLTPSGLNPLVYLALCLVVVAVVSVAGLLLRNRREEQVSEVEAPTRQARTRTPQRIRREEQVGAPTRYARAAPQIRREAEVPKPEIVIKVRKTTPAPGKSHCIYCGLEVPENAKFCPVCGKIIARCSVCNQHIASEDQFLECPHCGILSHRDHLLEWIKVKGFCPSCKAKLNQKDMI